MELLRVLFSVLKWIHDCTLFSRQVLMVSKDKPKEWIQDCTSALTQASTLFSSPDTDKAFGLFDSSLYCDKMEGYDENGEDYKDKNKDLIFKDCSSSLELIPEVILLNCLSLPLQRAGFQGKYIISMKAKLCEQDV